jgi:hypothetical protein
MSSDLMKKMDLLVERAPESRHSYFQLKHFVLGKEPTIQAKLWQCLREIEARRESIRSMEREIEETRDRHRLADVEMEKLVVSLRHKEKEGLGADKELLPLLRIETEVRVRQTRRQKEGLEEHVSKLTRQKRFAEQEARFFVQAFEAMEKVEALKDYDDLAAQADYWNQKVAEEINLRMLLQRPLDPETVRTALALPDQCPVKKQTAQTLHHIEQQMLELKQGITKKLERKNDADLHADAGV